ncbi:hypothetical protein H1043_05555 [Thermoactinomyces vulgaris]|uniref:EF-hand domain-containing protein n=1 Tax=Thermoactinomyces vulgaris TaxID=2026 RepID=A0ABS0QEF8_THEVU|nr:MULTISPECIES: Imm6 family immunity protein [Thermoactinomyces]MBA4551230.1 hypothetical protein [Thermoactinomyces vulgaris]MBA4595559.1 hypothetical protein [Thermoactinomyces vulgaris]MBH8587656.1 hypothetical protein [Thermoactinomyces vulgaris]
MQIGYGFMWTIKDRMSINRIMDPGSVADLLLGINVYEDYYLSDEFAEESHLFPFFEVGDDIMISLDLSLETDNRNHSVDYTGLKVANSLEEFLRKLDAEQDYYVRFTYKRLRINSIPLFMERGIFEELLGGRFMQWYMNINSEAGVAYLLCLTEKIINQVAEGKKDVRKAISMCWGWVEEKKHHADDIYEVFVNDEAQGVAMYYEFAEDPQQEVIWLCFNYAMEYTIWQAYEYENAIAVPQPIETVDDEIIDEFTKEIAKVDGYQEEWAERLKEYLLKHYPPDSDKKIKREELLNIIS